MSARDCEIIKIVAENIHSHPNADLLSVYKHNGIQVVIKSELWNVGDLALYCPCDSIVPDNIEEWTWAKGRVKNMKIRGVISEGVLLPLKNVPETSLPLNEYYNIGHYCPPETYNTQADSTNIHGPNGYYPKYDIDGPHKIVNFLEGEHVYVTEKLHGQNVAILYGDSTLYVRSRNYWKLDTPNNIFWKALRNTEGLIDLVKMHPNIMFFGEQIGHIPHFKYGLTTDDVKIKLFDMYDCITKEYKNYDVLNSVCGQFMVPTDYVGIFDENKIRSIASSTGHYQTLREGCVVKPLNEKKTYKGDRIMCKFINPSYFNKS
jgi:RNA ligase (TIGR02306 family)